MKHVPIAALDQSEPNDLDLRVRRVRVRIASGIKTGKKVGGLTDDSTPACLNASAIG